MKAIIGNRTEENEKNPLEGFVSLSKAAKLLGLASAITLYQAVKRKRFKVFPIEGGGYLTTLTEVERYRRESRNKKLGREPKPPVLPFKISEKDRAILQKIADGERPENLPEDLKISENAMMRADVILKASVAKVGAEVARSAGVTGPTMYFYLNEFSKKGVHGVFRGRIGRKPKTDS